MQCSLDRLIAPSFYKVHNSIEDYTHFWLCGGRGSTKSSFVSVEIILGIMKNADTNAVSISVSRQIRLCMWCVFITTISCLSLTKFTRKE